MAQEAEIAWTTPFTCIPGCAAGAGTIISSGFFKQKSFEEVESYINKLAPQSGDAVFFRTLWYLFKLGPTDPGGCQYTVEWPLQAR